MTKYDQCPSVNLGYDTCRYRYFVNNTFIIVRWYPEALAWSLKGSGNFAEDYYEHLFIFCFISIFSIFYSNRTYGGRHIFIFSVWKMSRGIYKEKDVCFCTYCIYLFIFLWNTPSSVVRIGWPEKISTLVINWTWSVTFCEFV